MLTLTKEPIEDYKYVQSLLKTWAEPIDDDVRIVFSGGELIDKEETVKRLPEVEEGLPKPPRRVRARMAPTTG
eukprot:13000112-Heterocapsa_arctica.AAC.1